MVDHALQQTRLSVEFGAVMPRYWVEYDQVKGLAQACERLGYGSVWLTDHLQPSKVSGPVLETWTTLTALAHEVKARVGAVALCYSYRHPAVLAKMAATLDTISGGRLELCIGAGSPAQEEENRAMGIPFPKPSVRIRQLREYIQVLKILWTCSGKADFVGKFFQLKAATCNCAPLQKPHPPLWIGGRGPLMLRNVGEMGENWNYFGLKPDDYADAIRIVEDSNRRKGIDPHLVRRSVFSGIVIAKTRRELEEVISKSAKARNMTVEDFFKNSFASIHGTPEECIELVETYRKLGASLFVLRDYDSAGGSLRLFGERVLPYFRDR